jgi:hypothetical protein
MIYTMILIIKNNSYIKNDKNTRLVFYKTIMSKEKNYNDKIFFLKNVIMKLSFLYINE